MMVPKSITVRLVKLTMASILIDMTVTFTHADGSGRQVTYRTTAADDVGNNLVIQPVNRDQPSLSDSQSGNQRSSAAVNCPISSEFGVASISDSIETPELPEDISVSMLTRVSNITERIRPVVNKYIPSKRQCMPLKDWDDDPDEELFTGTNVQGIMPANLMLKLRGDTPNDRRLWFNKYVTSDRNHLNEKVHDYSFHDLTMMDFRTRMNIRLLAWMVT